MKTLTEVGTKAVWVKVRVKMWKGVLMNWLNLVELNWNLVELIQFKMFMFIKAVSDTVFDMINGVYFVKIQSLVEMNWAGKEFWVLSLFKKL